MDKDTNLIYRPFSIGSLTVPNRLVRSATFEFAADEGRITQRHLDLWRLMAEGGCGLNITGMMATAAGGKIGPMMVECSYDGYVDDLKKAVEVAQKNHSLLFVQLNHAGYKTSPQDGHDRLGVRAMEVAPDRVYHEATLAEIQRIAEDFGRAAKRCQAAGIDGVQIHAAHGYLINTFLSPYYNHRADSYGGPMENRARLLFEVYEAVRGAVGQGYPVGVKLPISDRVEPSITLEESVYVAQRLEKLGLDMIEISAGLTMDGGDSSFSPAAQEGSEGLFLYGAKAVAEKVKIPTISVGGYRRPEFVEKVLAETPVAAISFCRPMIREPNLANRWKTDRSPATCLSCNLCFRSSEIIACQVDKK
ncbi:MAG: NADH:flavin oxidoreductase [Deltaproteobacteria bacterium]|nr:NADH:flavin oxidoreductase [Deltaproteobacteria bacterium]